MTAELSKTRAALVALVANGALLWLAIPAAADPVTQEAGPVLRPPLTGRTVLIVVVVTIIGLALWVVALLATKRHIIRSARVRRFRSELRHLDCLPPDQAQLWRPRRP